MANVLRVPLLSRFTCLADKCEDTCCQNWSMQVDEATIERYRSAAPELLPSVEAAQETPWIMRKDAASGMCVKLDGGKCGIHKEYGEKFLGDACYFYPRVTRALGPQVLMTATMSCPEITRLALFEDSMATMQQAEAQRLPQALKNYLPQGMDANDAMFVHQAFIGAALRKDFSSEMNLVRMANVSRALARAPQKDWTQALPLYFKMADGWLPNAEKNIADPFNLLHALAGLIVSSKKNPSSRLKETIDAMERALAVKLDWQNVLIHTNEKSLPAYEALKKNWQENFAEKFSDILRRWLAMQMSLALFPFAGLGHTVPERITIIGVRLATIKLALMCNCGMENDELPQNVVVRVVQSLSRFLDHLGDPTFLLSIYKETGWDKENRMCGLLEL